MSKANLRSITNSFQDVRLVSLASWRQAGEISPRDRGGPYVVLQEGIDPEDIKARADEFVLGRSGKWLSLRFFFQLPVPERREEFVFGTAGEVMQMMADLPTKVAIIRATDKPELKDEAKPAAGDEMAAAMQAGKSGAAT
jgi:hypothetical protein